GAAGQTEEIPRPSQTLGPASPPLSAGLVGRCAPNHHHRGWQLIWSFGLPLNTHRHHFNSVAQRCAIISWYKGSNTAPITDAPELDCDGKAQVPRPLFPTLARRRRILSKSEVLPFPTNFRPW